MKIISQKNIQNFSLPLPIFNSIHLADAVSGDGEEFYVFVGLNKEQVKQLKDFSLNENDAELQKNTGDRNRFGLGSYEEWYKKNRTPFCLIHKRTDSLAALVWFGPKNLGQKSIKFGQIINEYQQPGAGNNWHTISYRSYLPFRGKGLMKNFTKFSMDIYKKQFSNVLFWAGLDNRNKGSVKLLTSLNFEINEENSDLPQNWLVMIKK
jgi:hypothetical protein